MTRTQLAHTPDMAAFRRDGFTVVRGFLPRDRTDAVLEDVRQVFSTALIDEGLRKATDAADPVGSPDLFALFRRNEARYIGCMRVLQNIPSLQRIGVDGGVLDLLRSLGLLVPVYSTIPLLMLHHKDTARNTGYWKIPAHQDWRSIQGSLNCVVAWSPLVDVPAELGPLEVIPGSHRDGLRPCQDDEWYMHVVPEHAPEDAFRPVPMQRGDLLVFSAFLVHRSGTNRSDRHRLSIQFRYNDAAEPTFRQRLFPNPYHIKPQRELVTPDFPSRQDLDKTFGAEAATGQAGV